MQIKKKILWSFVAVVLAILTIMAVLSGSGDMTPAQFYEYVRGASLPWLLAALLSMSGFIFFEGEALRVILRHIGYPRGLRSSCLYSAADVYFSAITPSASGGQPASAYFMIKDGISGAAVTASLLANLVMYTLAVLIVGVTGFLMRPAIILHFAVLSRILIIIGLTVLLSLAVIFFLLLARHKVLFRGAGRLIRFLHKIHLIRHPDKYWNKLETAVEEYRVCVVQMAGQKRMLLIGLGFNLLQRISQMMVTIFVYLATGGSPSKLADLWSIQCFVVIGSNCVPIPGSMGVVDYLMVDGYQYLMDRQAAFRLELLSRGLSFYGCILISAAVSLAGYLWLRRRKKTV